VWRGVVDAEALLSERGAARALYVF